MSLNASSALALANTQREILLVKIFQFDEKNWKLFKFDILFKVKGHAGLQQQVKHWWSKIFYMSRYKTIHPAALRCGLWIE